MVLPGAEGRTPLVFNADRVLELGYGEPSIQGRLRSVSQAMARPSQDSSIVLGLGEHNVSPVCEQPSLLGLVFIRRQESIIA